MTTVLPFANNSIEVFTYEGFDYTISNLNLAYTLQTVSNSTGLKPSELYFTKDGNNSYRFSVSDALNNLTPGTTESFTLRTIDGSGTVYTSSNTVSIEKGRFLDASGLSLSNTSYTFFKNEAIQDTLGRPLRLVAPSFTLKTPTSTPALPPGLSFVSNASNIYDISGVPRTTVPNSNYFIIGVEEEEGGGKVVTTRINMVISNERLRFNLNGSSIVNNMQIGTAITPRVFTAIPPIGSGNIQYSFPSLPDGIVATDSSGNVQTSPFIPSDPSYTMIISGTPTLAAAVAFKNVGITTGGSNVTVRVTRFSPTLLENSQAINFSFGETVLFDTPTLSNNYVGIPVDQSLNFFRAATYFTSNVPISNIFSPDLRSDLSLIFVPALSRAELSGNNPFPAGSASYTFRAVNSNGISNDIQQTISISNDFAIFSSPVGVDLCYNFILSRPLTQFKTGYYESNIRFVATAASGRPVTLTAPALSGTGLSLDSNGILTGIPSTVTPLTDLVVTATVSGSPATATKTVKFAILNDVFTFGSVAASNLKFIQNVAATPVQFPVSTLSERNIINYSQTGFPDGLSINPAGVLSGTPTSSSPTSGTATVNATTGYASGSSNFNYTLIPDSMLFVLSPTNYAYQAGQSVGNIDIDAVTYSGTTVSNYDLSINPTYGMTINASNGILSGTWTTGVPPAQLLPSSCNFSVTAQAGTLVGALPAVLTANPVVSNAMFFVGYGNPTGESDFNSWLYYTTPSDVSSFTRIIPMTTTAAFTDIGFKNNIADSNTCLITSTSQIHRATRLDNFSDTLPSNALMLGAVANKTGTSTWWVAGSDILSTRKAALLKSTDDGITWDLSSSTVISSGGSELVTRDSNNSVNYNTFYRPYLRGGVALRYSSYSGVLMVGGLYNVDNPVMLRSTDDGSNWSNVNGEFGRECANYNLDTSSMWIATGSDAYKSIDFVPAFGSPQPFTSATDTIKYSTDQGLNWTAATGAFNMFGYEVAYGNNSWLATGVSAYFNGGQYRYIPELRFSTDGSNWSTVTLASSNLFNPSNTNRVVAPLRIGSMNFDGNYWNVLVNVEPQVSGGGSIPTLYRHDASSSLANGWTGIDVCGSLAFGEPEANPNLRFLTFREPKYLFDGEPPINITLGFNTLVGSGPTFTSPTTFSYIQYQYIPIAPIQVSATGTGQVYFFVETVDLPPGLSFNQITGVITGTPARAGYDTVTIYAKDNNGVSSIVLNFTTLVPRIIRKQDGAGAYTSLLRQYTEVLGAQNARDSRVFPNQERALGEFMSPEAPDVVTQTVDQKCFDPTCLQ